eukprot:6178510-Pleurochrysis_carterae.AAC.8
MHRCNETVVRVQGHRRISNKESGLNNIGHLWANLSLGAKPPAVGRRGDHPREQVHYPNFFPAPWQVRPLRAGWLTPLSRNWVGVSDRRPPTLIPPASSR